MRGLRPGMFPPRARLRLRAAAPALRRLSFRPRGANHGTSNRGTTRRRTPRNGLWRQRDGSARRDRIEQCQSLARSGRAVRPDRTATRWARQPLVEYRRGRGPETGNAAESRRHSKWIPPCLPPPRGARAAPQSHADTHPGSLVRHRRHRGDLRAARAPRGGGRHGGIHSSAGGFLRHCRFPAHDPDGTRPRAACPSRRCFDQVGTHARTVQDLALFDSVRAGDPSPLAAKPLRACASAWSAINWFVGFAPRKVGKG